MRKHTSALSLSRSIEERLRQKQASLAEGIQEVAKGTFADLDELTSGTESQASLNQDGNPYGRGFLSSSGKRRGRRPDGLINKQKGRLNSSRFMERKVSGGKVTFKAGFRDNEKYFAFILARGGTRNMRDRGVWREIERRFKARKLGLRNALRRS